MICTTLKAIKEHYPCSGGWKKLLKHLGKTKCDDEPFPLVEILKSNGLDDAHWCLRSVDHKSVRLYAVACAREVQHLMTDARSLKALDVAEAYAKGEATEEELEQARNAACDATDAANAANAAAANAAYSAKAACDAAIAAYAATANAAAAAACDAAARKRQAELFIQFFGE